MRRSRKHIVKIGPMDKYLLASTVILTIVGLIAVADASAPIAIRNFSDQYYFVKQQFVWMLVGFILLTVSTFVKYTFWEKFILPIFAFNIILLVMVLIPGIGTKALGAKRWIDLGIFSIQPSELIKLTLAFFIAKISVNNNKLISFFIPIILVSFLVMLQPDLGTTIIILGLSMAQIFIAGVNIFAFIRSLLSVGFVGFILTQISSYRRERLATYLAQTKDPLGKGYHIRQIILALGSGGLFGIGLGQSRQKYLFLPETATDSIFAIIAEEVGFVGSCALILVFVYFILRGLKIAKNAPDKFSQVLSIGIIAWIGGQAFLNIGSMVAVVPLTGIPLPFISYGGSSLSTILMSVGILLNISKYAKGS